MTSSYPPGAPLLMAGEILTQKSCAVPGFLLLLCSVGKIPPVSQRIFTVRSRMKMVFIAYER